MLWRHFRPECSLSAHGFNNPQIREKGSLHVTQRDIGAVFLSLFALSPNSEKPLNAVKSAACYVQICIRSGSIAGVFLQGSSGGAGNLLVRQQTVSGETLQCAVMLQCNGLLLYF